MPKESSFDASRLRLALLCAVATASPSILAGNFGGDGAHSWAVVPAGRFECRVDASTKHAQVLTFGGREIARHGPSVSDIAEGTHLSGGIYDFGSGCPQVVDVHDNYMLARRLTSPPDYGLQGYVVVDFAADPIELYQLAIGQQPEDDRIDVAHRAQWHPGRLTFTYFGYNPDETGGSKTSPRPKTHVLELNLKDGSTDQYR